MIESLLNTFARSATWTVGRQAGRQLFRQLGWLIWLVVIALLLVVGVQNYGVEGLWNNFLRSWLTLSAGLLPLS